MIFLRINLPNFEQFKQYQGKSGPRRTTRYCVQSKIFQFLANVHVLSSVRLSVVSLYVCLSVCRL